MLTLAGNTTMTQLLLKVEPRYIRRSPYVPAARIYPHIRACDVGIDLDDHVTPPWFIPRFPAMWAAILWPE